MAAAITDPAIAQTITTALINRGRIRCTFQAEGARISGRLAETVKSGHSMAGFNLVLLGTLLFIGAALYASVGQAGATAFIAAMGVIGMPAATMRPTALALNILAAAFSTWRFHSAGLVAWRMVRPFALAAVPCAFVGGAIALPDTIYRPVVGIVLPIAAALLFRRVVAGTATDDATAGDDPLIPFHPTEFNRWVHRGGCSHASGIVDAVPLLCGCHSGRHVARRNARHPLSFDSFHFGGHNVRHKASWRVNDRQLNDPVRVPR